jgi:hypothetical protein
MLSPGFLRALREFDRVLTVVLPRLRTAGAPKIPFELEDCPQAEKDHQKSWRLVAHTFHKGRGVVCVAHSAFDRELCLEEVLGVLLHEVGHVSSRELRRPVHAGASRSSGTEDFQAEADATIFDLTGLRILYNARGLETVDLESFKELEKS